MAVHTCTRGLVVALGLALVTGCPFAKNGGPMPSGHKCIEDVAKDQVVNLARRTMGRSLQITDSNPSEATDGLGQLQCEASACLIAWSDNMRDEKDGFVSLGLSTLNWKRNNLVAIMSKEAQNAGEDLCYWSMQTLPRPHAISAASIAREGDEEWLAQARSIHAYGQMAHDRFQERYDGIDGVPADVHVGGLTTYGTEVNTALCNAGVLTGDRCSYAVLNSEVPCPVASAIFRITGDNDDDVIKAVEAWRTEEGGHKPNIDWVIEANQASTTDPPSNWGNNGGLTAKLVKCSEIPERFVKNIDTPDSLVPGHNDTALFDDAVVVWGSLESQCDKCTYFIPFVMLGGWIYVGILAVLLLSCCCCVGCFYGGRRVYKSMNSSKGDPNPEFQMA